MERLLLVAGLTALIHLINTVIYAVRVAGVRTGRPATAMSIFNVVFLLSSTANMIQGPLMATIVEGTILSAATPAVREQALAFLAGQIRLVLAAATLGTLLGFLGQRSFARIFAAGVSLFEYVGGSVPRLLGLLLCRPRRAAGLARRHALPFPPAVRSREPAGRLPRGFLVLNVLVTGIFTTGVLSALYAGALYPDYRASATMLASLVNGVAQVLFATVVDPTAARLTDQALQGQRPFADVQRMSLYLAATRLAGTVLAQAVFLPAAYLIRAVALLIT